MRGEVKSTKGKGGVIAGHPCNHPLKNQITKSDQVGLFLGICCRICDYTNSATVGAGSQTGTVLRA